MYDFSIIGSGKIGTAVGVGFEQLDNSVIFYNIDENRVEHLKELGHKATSELKQALSKSSLIFICVPTPSHADRGFTRTDRR